MAKVRIATVKATGLRYIVSRMYFPKNPNEKAKAYCWGEVVAYRGTQAKHEKSKIFIAEAVDVVEVERTEALMLELFEQNVSLRRKAGHIIERRGRKNLDYIDHGTKEQMEKRDEINAKIARILRNVRGY